MAAEHHGHRTATTMALGQPTPAGITTAAPHNARPPPAFETEPSPNTSRAHGHHAREDENSSPSVKTAGTPPDSSRGCGSARRSTAHQARVPPERRHQVAEGNGKRMRRASAITSTLASSRINKLAERVYDTANVTVAAGQCLSSSWCRSDRKPWIARRYALITSRSAALSVRAERACADHVVCQDERYRPPAIASRKRANGRRFH